MRSRGRRRAEATRPRGVSSRCRPARISSKVSARSATTIAPAITPSSRTVAGPRIRSPSVLTPASGADRRRGDDVHRRGPDAAHDRRDRQRQLDPADDLELGHPHPAGGVDGAAVDLAHPDEGVCEDRRDAEDRHRDRHVEVAGADEGDHQRDQGQLGDRAAGVADRDREELADAAVAEPEPDRQRDRVASSERDDADRDLGARSRSQIWPRPPTWPPAWTDVALVEDEVDRAAEASRGSAGTSEHGDHSARTFRHGAMKRCASTSRPSKPIASATARTLPKTMFVLKTPRWMPSL